MKENRELEFEVICRDGNYVCFRISKQSHRGDNFTPNCSHVYKHLRSCGRPSVDSDFSDLYVRGVTLNSDNNLMICTDKQFTLFEVDKNSYNEEYNNNGIL